MAHRKQGERERGQDHSGSGKRHLAEYFDEPPDQASLDDYADNPDETKHVTIGLRVVAETLLGEQGEKSRHDREADDEKKVGGDDDAEHGAAPVPENFEDAGLFMRSSAMLARQTFRQDEI